MKDLQLPQRSALSAEVSSMLALTDAGLARLAIAASNPI
jgi:hypothetical protein